MATLLQCLLVLFLVISSGWGRLCCDQECKRPVSYGRTKDRYITQEAGHLSFPNAAIVTILIKQAYFDSSGQELWFAEIQGRKGLVPAHVVTELHTLCEPKDVDGRPDGPDNLNAETVAELNIPPSSLPPINAQDTNTPHIHQSEVTEPHRSTIQEHFSTEQQDVPGYQGQEQLPTDDEQGDSTGGMYGHPVEEPNNLEWKEDNRDFNGDRSNVNYMSQSGDPSQKISRYVDNYSVEHSEHEFEEQKSSVYPETYEREQTITETHGQPSPAMDTNLASSSTASHDSNFGSDDSVQAELLQQSQGDINHGDQMPMSEFGDVSLQNVDEELYNHNENNQPESDTASGADMEDLYRIPPSSNLPSFDDNQVYTEFPSDNIVNETPTVDGENVIGGVAEDLDPKSSGTEQVTGSHTDYDTWSTEGVESVAQQIPLNTPSPSYESEAQGIEGKLVTLGNGQSVRLVPLGGGNFKMTAEDGSVRVVNYDYFDEDEELDYDYQYDYAGLNTRKTEQNEVEENQERENILPEQIQPVIEKSEVDEGYPSNYVTDKEMLQSYEAEEVSEYTLTPTTTVDESTASQQHHTYLDVHSLRQRYEINTDSDNVQQITTEDVNEHTFDDVKFTSVEDVLQSTSETFPNHGVTETELPLMGTEQVRVAEATKNTFEAETHLPSAAVEQSVQPVTTSTTTEEIELNILVKPTTQLPDMDSSLEDVNLQATHLPLPVMGKVSQQYESSEEVHPSMEPLPAENHKQTYIPVNTNVKSQEHSDPQAPFVKLVAQFSPELAAWIGDQGAELGILGVIASAVCLLIPVCCSCCHFWKDSRRKTVALSKFSASRRGLEEQIEKLKAEKKTINAELLLLEERHGSLQDELEHMKHEIKTLTEVKVNMEENYVNVCSELDSLKQELSACTAQVNQLRSELKHEQMQLSAQTNEKEVALQQVTFLQNQMRECEQKIQELEAAKEQLEQDSFSTHSHFQELEELHKQVTQELAGSKSENAELNSSLQALQAEVSSLQQTKNDNIQEIQTLQTCLSQLVASTAGDTDQQVEVNNGETQNVNSTDTLLKIQAMLDTTKVQAELQAVTVERDKNITTLEEQSRLVEKLQEENSGLREHSNNIEVQLSLCTADYQKLQDKHRTLTEYFEQKEHNLHRKLGAEEAVRQAVETREAQVKEKAQSLEQAETRHREELKQLRSEMFEIEKSLMSQVHSCQKRAEEAIAEQRRLEQECKTLKLERDDLRKRVKSVSPLGAISDQPHSHISRPPSAPYLPRTSSPGVGDTRDHVLNQTDPGPLPSSQPQLSTTRWAEPSPFFPPPDQRGRPLPPPLQHPVPERERPRYPIPPPGRRLIRGYPPFDRRPPRPGVFPVPRFYHDVNRAPERRRPVSNPPPGATPTPPLGVYDPHTSHNMVPINHDSSSGFVPVAPPVQEPTFGNPEGEQVPLQRPEGRKL